MKRFLSVLIAVLTVAAVLAGCGGNAPDNSTPGGSTAGDNSGSSGSTSGDSSAGDGDKYFDTSEFVEISIMVIAPEEDPGADKEGNLSEHLLWLYDEYNFKFNFWTGLTWSNYIDQVNIWLLGGDLPDLIFMDVQTHRYDGWLDWQQLGRFRPYDMDHYPNIKKAVVDEGTPGQQKFILDDGLLWTYSAWIDSVRFSGSQGQLSGFSYRKDWAQQVGMYKENGYYTWNEFTNMIKAVVEADCAGNGRTAGLASLDWMMPAYWGAGSYAPYFLGYSPDGQGGYAWAPSLPGALDAVKLMNQMYKDGLIYQDQYMAFAEDVDSAWEGNQLFARIESDINLARITRVVEEYSMSEWGPNDSDRFNKAIDRIDFAVFETPDGLLPQYSKLDSWGETAMNANISDLAAYRWQAILDFLITDEGYFFKNMGIKGKDWDYDENGNPKNMWTTIDETTGQKKAPHHDFHWWAWSRSSSAVDSFNELFGDAVPPELKKIIENVYAAYRRDNVMLIPEQFELKGLSVDDFPEFLATGTREMQTLAQLKKMLLSDDVEKEWNDWVASQMPLFERAVAELNAAYKK